MPRPPLEEIEQVLYSAAISDALDDVGLRNQAMRENLRPVYDCAAFAGWARTISFVDAQEISENPYAMEIEALDSILRDEVVVVATGCSRQNAPWGELLSTAARARGARGAVIDGFVRDIKKIESLRFPVFATGIKPVDSKGRGLAVSYNEPIECGDVAVNPGDLVFADHDGVVVVPQSAAEEVLRRATEKVTRENHTREELAQGVFLRDVYRKYGVL